MPADAASAARRRNGSRWLLVVGVALGAIFGVAISTSWHRDADQRTSHDSANRERRAAPVAATANTHESVAMARVRALETRLQALESQRSQDAATKPMPREPLSPEQGRMLVRAEVDRVRREARDPSWAPGAEKSFTTELRDLAAKGRFELGVVSCGTTSCIAEVAWDADAQPIEHANAILHHQFSINCVRTVLGPTPEQMVSGGKNRGQVLFDCTDARAEAR